MDTITYRYRGDNHSCCNDDPSDTDIVSASRNNIFGYHPCSILYEIEVGHMLYLFYFILIFYTFYYRKIITF